MCWTVSEWVPPRRCEHGDPSCEDPGHRGCPRTGEDWKDNLGASSRNHFKAYLDSGLSLVAEEDGEIVGFIFAQMLHHICDEENLLWIENMGVHPYFRRNMIGYKLLRECVRLGREQGATVAHASIQPDNAPSILMFKKLGFFMDRREVALLDLRDEKLRL